MGNVVRLIVDKLQNALTGQGTVRDPRSATFYAFRAPMTQEELTAAWRGSGLVRKIVSIPALDMVREWREWKARPEEVAAIEKAEKRLRLPQKIRQLEVLRGRGGGALILGLPDDPGTPAPELIGRDQLAYVNVVSRWQLTFDALCDDAGDARFGEPAMYRMRLAQGSEIALHPSRVIPFRADTTGSLADTLSPCSDADAFWGESTIAQVLDAVQDCDTARGAFAALMHKARLLRIGIPGLMDLVSTAEGEKNVMRRLAILASAESIHNATIFDAGGGEGHPGEEITDAQYNFAGARDILEAYAEFVAAISDIPATRLLGRAPEGMNASGESQQRDWEKMIRARQTLELQPCLDRLDSYLLQSALGRMDEAIWYEWSPLDTPDRKETAERFKTEMDAIEMLQATGAIPEPAFARAVQSKLIEEGYLPGLEAALKEVSDTRKPK